MADKLTVADLVDKYGKDRTVAILVNSLGWSPDEAEFIILLSTGVIKSDVVIEEPDDDDNPFPIL